MLVLETEVSSFCRQCQMRSYEAEEIQVKPVSSCSQINNMNTHRLIINVLEYFLEESSSRESKVVGSQLKTDFRVKTQILESFWVPLLQTVI